ncbi:hypothetical protein RCG23_13520 [Neobacillus sp. PS3-34]|uniref:hypothetical protein n=1 Tax=Neobacillus sp. PS3-34 TaxID=3070678 RepID=UPI0027DF5C8E|nr:hypothetical protein [Neobacillus sp. PS3-34]WML46669.1 hypothetical protein RCG23_13520 [Neobacillus sp. PS3-34]
MKIRKIVTALFAFLLIFSSFSYSAFAADNTKAIDVLLKGAEKQAAPITKQVNISSPSAIKAINTKAITGLASANDKVKKLMKGYKGKQKAAFDKRVKAIDLALSQAKIFNSTIINGEILARDYSTFKKGFTASPFSSEKAYVALKKKSDQFTKDLAKLAFNKSRVAFSNKYQTTFVAAQENMESFFGVNKRIDSFFAFTLSHEDTEVWDEFYAIGDAVVDEIADPKLSTLLSGKWEAAYQKNFIAPEKDAIEQHLKSFVAAYNARDVVAMADLYPLNEEQKGVYRSLKSKICCIACNFNNRNYQN